MNHSNKVIEFKDGMVELPVYSQSVRNTSNDLGLQLASEVQGGGYQNLQSIVSW